MTISLAAIRTPDGRVHSGPTHDEAREAAIAAGADIPLDGEVGFVTDAGSFLCRRDAAAHALHCGQVRQLGAPPYLYCDDLLLQRA